VVLKYVECINKGDAEGVASLTADKFVFTDVPGRVHVFCGREAITECWKGYFMPFPDYKIHVHHVLTGGASVAIIGKTTGSHVSPEVEARSTVLWVAEVRNGLVTEWRIYSDEAYAQQS